MMAWLLERHSPRNWGGGSYYSDTGIDVEDAFVHNHLMGNVLTKPRIIGLVWRGDPDSPYVLKTSIYGKTRYFAIDREDQ